MLTVRAFRSLLKPCFDDAELGKDVLIVRNGAVFRLSLEEMQQAVINDPEEVETLLQVGIPVRGPTYVKQSVKAVNLCNHSADVGFCKFKKCPNSQFNVRNRNG